MEISVKFPSTDTIVHYVDLKSDRMVARTVTVQYGTGTYLLSKKFDRKNKKSQGTVRMIPTYICMSFKLKQFKIYIF